jgi:hypothetical protein
MRKIHETGLAKRGIVTRQFQDGFDFAACAIHGGRDHTSCFMMNANQKQPAGGMFHEVIHHFVVIGSTVMHYESAEQGIRCAVEIWYAARVGEMM